MCKYYFKTVTNSEPHSFALKSTLVFTLAFTFTLRFSFPFTFTYFF